MRAWLWLPLAGCGLPWWDEGTQTGSEVPDSCAEASREDVAGDAVIEAFGTSPDAIRAELSGAFTGTWEDDAATADITAGGAQLVTYDVVMREVEEGQGSGADAALDCSPKLVWAVDLGFEAGDGALNEALAGEVVASASDAATLFASEPLTAVGGTARPVEIVPGDWDAVDLVASANFDGSTWVGSWMWQATNAPSGDTGTVDVAGMTEGAGAFTLGR